MSKLAPLSSTIVAPMHRATHFELRPTHVIVLAAIAMSDEISYSGIARITPFSIDTLRGNSGPIYYLLKEGFIESFTKRAVKNGTEKLFTLTPSGIQVLSLILTGKED